MLQQYIGLVDGFKMTTLVILILVDFVLGIIVALKAGTFEFSKIANFLNTTILAFVGGYLVVGLVALVHPEFAYLVTAAWGLLDVGLLGGIWGKLGKLGLPVPEIVNKIG